MRDQLRPAERDMGEIAFICRHPLESSESNRMPPPTEVEPCVGCGKDMSRDYLCSLCDKAVHWFCATNGRPLGHGKHYSCPSCSSSTATTTAATTASMTAATATSKKRPAPSTTAATAQRKKNKNSKVSSNDDKRSCSKRLSEQERLEIISKLRRPNPPSKYSLARQYNVSEKAVRKVWEKR